MQPALTAEDLWPLVQKLPHDEQVRLAKLTLMAASRGPGTDSEAYRAAPPAPDEFSSEDDPLAWEAEGWGEGGCEEVRSAGTPLPLLTNADPF